MAVLGRSALINADIIVSQGADNTFKFRYKVDNGAGAQPVDLTTWTARSQLRRKVGGDIWLTMTSDDAITLDDEGMVIVHIADTVTEGEAWNSYSKIADGEPVALGVWDLELASPDGYVVRLLEGSVTVAPDVTRLP